MHSKNIKTKSHDHCTTILVGKNASFDGSTLMARTEDAPAGCFDPKTFNVVTPEKQPKVYVSVEKKCEVKLPENPMSYTQISSADPKRMGVWGEAGINEVNVGMSETETISSNDLVQGADPLVDTGLGEEDYLTLVLPYIKSARDGVKLLASYLEKYGTFEMNGIGFQDENEVWWMETIGGHHWIAKRVPDDSYAVIPNQQGIKEMDLVDALGEQKDHMCSKDMAEFITENKLDLEGKEPPEKNRNFNSRLAFGSRSDFDHTYNTCRAFIMLNYFNQKDFPMDTENVQKTFECDNLPWSYIPEHKITIQEIKNILSNVYQGTKFDPYQKHGDLNYKGKYRFIGINRTSQTAITQIRGYVPDPIKGIQWISFGSNFFTTFIPQYARIKDTPAYLKDTDPEKVDTSTYYWSSRLIAALSDSHIDSTKAPLDHYRTAVGGKSYEFINEVDKKVAEEGYKEGLLEEQNQKMADYFQGETSKLLSKVLFAASTEMKNSFSRSDA